MAMADLFPGKDIGQMNLNHRHRQGSKGIGHRQAVVPIGSGIEDHALATVSLGLEDIDNLSLPIGLKEIDLKAPGLGIFPNPVIDCSQAKFPVKLGLPAPASSDWVH